ncbi:hypothetical protein BJY24_004119 [Nocardia transvalensis]|uniref:Uncharacterized protein n=1 Tax=Nocardia transvalensis TaxID=37333 RepID=A0A7W9PFQ0_9NOCA|nr:hypothetical protein [Nocardia transvalensis]MBB5915252.1 hypothetical protein [Nocardia transvalensis]
MNHIPGPLPLPKQAALFLNARGRVADARRELGDAVDWLHESWDPGEGRLPAVAAAARSAAQRKIAAAKALLDEAAGELDAANDHYRAQRRARDAQRVPPDRVCDRDATHCVEGYSPRDGSLYGSLDLMVFACDEHHDIARTQWLTGLTAHSQPVSPDLPPRTCGVTTDWRAVRAERQEAQP